MQGQAFPSGCPDEVSPEGETEAQAGEWLAQGHSINCGFQNIVLSFPSQMANLGQRGWSCWETASEAWWSQCLNSSPGLGLSLGSAPLCSQCAYTMPPIWIRLLHPLG